MKALIINGSHRAGNTDIAIKKVIKVLKERKIFTFELKLRNIEMKLPDGCEACAEGELCPDIHDEFSDKIEPTIRDYDIYILATPTWDDGITPLTKIFWDRIVSWCHDDRKYLKGKKIAIITHGMTDSGSWQLVVNWVKSICIWEEAIFGGSLSFHSKSRVGNISLKEKDINVFIDCLINNNISKHK